jgi:hypothetical protein
VNFLRIAVAAGCLATAIACSDHHPPEDRPCECAADEICSAGRCVAPCTLDPAATATLDPSLTIVEHFCAPLEEGPLGATLRADGSIELVQVRSSTEGRDTTLTVEHFRAAPGASVLEVVGEPCTTTFTADRDSVVVDLLNHVAVSPDGSEIAFAVHAAYEPRPDYTEWMPGRFYTTPRERCAIAEHEFFRASGLAFGGARELFVAGAVPGSVSDYGLFLGDRRVWRESTPGSVWRLGDSLLLGGVLGHGVQPATLIALDRIRSGLELTEADVLQADARTNRFVLIEARGIVSVGPMFYSGGGAEPVPTGLELRTIATEPDLSFSEPTLLAGPSFEAVVPIVGSSTLFLLRHSSGLLLVE